MPEKIYTPKQIEEMLRPVFDGYKVKRAVLFGSYAKGLAEERSDIDILVDSGLRGLAFYGLLEDVSVTLGKNVDLLDVSQIRENSPVGKEISQSGMVIYG